MTPRHVLERLGAELEPYFRMAVSEQLRASHAAEIDYCLERGLLSTRASNSPRESDTGMLYVTRLGRRTLREMRNKDYLDYLRDCLRKK